MDEQENHTDLPVEVRICIICECELSGDISSVYEKGLRRLLDCSVARNDERLSIFCREKLSCPEKIKLQVHCACRKRYTLGRNVAAAIDSVAEAGPSPKKLRSSYDNFSYMTKCLLCGETAFTDDKHPNRASAVYEVRTLSTMETLRSLCRRRNDSWAREVTTRLNGCSCLVAAEARYHKLCYTKFYQPERGHSVGRPVDDEMQRYFVMMCDWFENKSEAELYTLDELMDVMNGLANGSQIYSKKMLKNKLRDRYGDHIFFAQRGGSSADYVCFRDMASYILNQIWTDKMSENKPEQIVRLMRMCARVIKEEIREREYIREYPTLNEIRDPKIGMDFMTSAFRIFLEDLITDPIKRMCIGHIATQAIRPRTVIAPIPFGLSIEIDHMIGSRWLIDHLNKLGLGISYEELRLFKTSILQDDSVDPLMPSPYPVFTQWAVDNADSTVCTIDGGGQFHAIGVIAMSNTNASVASDYRIQRRARMDSQSVSAFNRVPIKNYVGCRDRALSRISMKPVVECMRPYVYPPDLTYYNLLWESSRRLGASNIPNWSGYMQHVFQNSVDPDDVQKWDVTILPIVNLNPNDDTGIYTALAYISDQAQNMGLPDCAVTFDQPLFVKAVEIVETKQMKNVVVRLGGFHLLMSAIGAIFRQMQGSGIEEALEQIYGENVIKHIMSGKAYDRAVRAITLLAGALMNLMIEKASELSNSDLSALDELFKLSLNDPSAALTEIYSHSDQLDKFASSISDLKKSLSKSRTAKLWMQFLDHVNTVKDFIAAERLSNWELHLDATSRLLNVLAASNHIHYTKSTRLYLQRMRELPDCHPWLYEKFAIEGQHAVRRSQRVWAGLSVDLVIEQVMMRAIKTQSGLTRGRGLTESVQTLWIGTMHTESSIHDAMMTITGEAYSTSFQHVEMGKSRQERDTTDFRKLISWFQENDPLDVEVTDLRSVATGLVAHDGDAVNCDQADAVGQSIHEKLDGKSFVEATIKKCDTTKTLRDLQPGLKIERKSTVIDPAVLFMRCTALASRQEDIDEASFFSFEMTPVPTSLFKGSFMRKSVKSDLARYLETDVTNCITDTHSHDTISVIDGGWLLHQVSWIRGQSYAVLADSYCRFVKKYGTSTVVIFDGYDSSVKDHEHARRDGKKAPNISIMENAEIYKDREVFLKNLQNKSNLISLLAKRFNSNGVGTILCDDDADYTVIKTAVKYAIEGQTVSVVCEDTDVLVGLVHHCSNTDNMAEIFLRKDIRNAKRYEQRLYKISEVLQKVDSSVIKYILFCHAWSGCDTTSSTFGQGKLVVVRKLMTNGELRRHADIIADVNSSVEDVGNSGVAVFRILYGGKDSETLTGLRFRKYQLMVSSAKKIDPERLPPTERAAKQHSLRVHLQIVRWALLDSGAMDPSEWGWSKKECWRPTMTDNDVAHELVLKYIRCTCQSADRMCASNRCSCRKNGLPCVMACSGCNGTECENGEKFVDDDSDAGT